MTSHCSAHMHTHTHTQSLISPNMGTSCQISITGLTLTSKSVVLHGYRHGNLMIKSSNLPKRPRMIQTHHIMLGFSFSFMICTVQETIIAHHKSCSIYSVFLQLSSHVDLARLTPGSRSNRPSFAAQPGPAVPGAPLSSRPPLKLSAPAASCNG